MLRYNLFYSTAGAVFEQFTSHYRRRGLAAEINFYRERNGWVVVELDAGWEWELRREVQLAVSDALGCPGFLVFVYDGDYWGYEFFDRGEAVDHFVQEPTGEPSVNGRPKVPNSGQPSTTNEALVAVAL
jgi:hypothetical protein